MKTGLAIRTSLHRSVIFLRNRIGSYKGLSHSEIRFPTYTEEMANMIRYSIDPVRYATMALALERIRAEKIPGALAEVGVHRGYTSTILHTQMPERTLYLFDTFRGFPGHTDGRFSDTSVEFVKERLGDLRNIEFRIGAFPETSKGLEQEAFSFVLFDADEYGVGMDTFNFFYPRLSKGGYFILNDFNSEESSWGVSRAASEFLRDKPEMLVEIPDIGGSALFRKI